MDEPNRVTAHQDRYTLDRLPPPALQPRFVFEQPEFQFPARLNAGAALIDAAIMRGWGERPALLWDGGAWSYAELAARANRSAQILVRRLAVAPGNRVLLRAPNSPMQAALWLGALKAGAVVVAVMPLLRARDLAPMLARAGVGLALTDAAGAPVLAEASAIAGEPCRIVTFDPWGDGEELGALAGGVPDSFDPVATAGCDPALIAFTSGTTGAPKATAHFHRDILAIAECYPRSVLGAGPADRFLCSAPLAFTFGLGGQLVFPLRHGAASVLLPAAAPSDFAAAVDRFRPSIVMTAPTAYRAMLRQGLPPAAASVRHYVSAGEHLSAATARAWRDATGRAILEGIGATEMLHIFAGTMPGEGSPGSVGRALPGYRVRIVDDGMVSLPPGACGRLAVIGPTGCRYLDDPRQRAYVRDGWNLTGDLFAMDEDGALWFQGRADDLIVSAGYNLSGAEIEDALALHPAVAECVVVASPDAERGAVAKAFVRVAPGFAESPALAAELQDFVKKTIAPYKYPRAVAFVADLPRNAVGKLQRSVLREAEFARQSQMA